MGFTVGYPLLDPPKTPILPLPTGLPVGPVWPVGIELWLCRGTTKPPVFRFPEEAAV
jgi:hypothetical protein